MSSTHLIPKRVGVLWGALVVIFVVTPLLAIVCVSFSKAQFISFPWDEGFSLRWYAAIPEQQAFISAGWNSVKLALYTAVISVVIGTFGALAAVRYSFPGRALVTLLGSSPLFVPQVLTGLALTLALSASGIASGLLVLLIGHIVITIPFVLRISTAALTGFNLDQERAAQNLGASKLRAFVTVTLPQIRSGILAGGIMSLIVSFDNVALSIFLTGPGFDVLPVYLYVYAVNNLDGIAAAVSVSMIALSLAGVVILEWLVGLDKLFGGEIDA